MQQTQLMNNLIQQILARDEFGQNRSLDVDLKRNRRKSERGRTLLIRRVNQTDAHATRSGCHAILGDDFTLQATVQEINRAILADAVPENGRRRRGRDSGRRIGGEIEMGQME